MNLDYGLTPQPLIFGLNQTSLSNFLAGWNTICLIATSRWMFKAVPNVDIRLED